MPIILFSNETVAFQPIAVSFCPGYHDVFLPSHDCYLLFLFYCTVICCPILGLALNLHNVHGLQLCIQQRKSEGHREEHGTCDMLDCLPTAAFSFSF